MIKKVFSFLIVLTLFTLLIGCDSKTNDDKTVEGNEKNSDIETAETDENVEEVEEVEEVDGDDNAEVTLPDSFPKDFPFPENIQITEVDDDSDEEKYSYSISFDFNPNIDLDATFEMYKDYTEKIGYDIIIGGEEYFAEGIFQFGANKKMSTDDMFVVTIKPENGAYGSIDLDISK